MRGYALVNESTRPELTPAVMSAHASALDAQQRDVADWWERAPLPVSCVGSEKDVPVDSGIVLATYVDTLSDPDALAYHTVDQYGRPRIYIGVGIVLANGGTISGPGGLLSAASHELIETTVDPYCGFNVDLPDGSAETPLEAADWTQGDSYEQKGLEGLFVSNFCGPRCFDASAKDGPWDRMGLMSGPFQLRPGGYWSLRTGGPGGQWTATFGKL